QSGTGNQCTQPVRQTLAPVTPAAPLAAWPQALPAQLGIGEALEALGPGQLEQPMEEGTGLRAPGEAVNARRLPHPQRQKLRPALIVAHLRGQGRVRGFPSY